MKPFGFFIKKIALISVIIVLSVLVIFIANAFISAYRLNYFQFNEKAEKIKAQTKKVMDKAENYNESKVLASYNDKSLKNRYYRFDENIVDAQCRIDNTTPPHRVNFNDINCEFNNRDDLVFRPKQNKFSINEGILKYTHTNSNVLQSSKELNLKRGTCSYIKIRLKNKKSEKMMLAWSNKPDSEIYDPYKNDYFAFRVIPDNKFHTYRLNVDHILKGFSKKDAKIKTISLFPFKTEEKPIEIDFIRFVSKKSKYINQHYGVAYENINDEMRKIIFTAPPIKLSYTVLLPKTRPILKFGTGVLNSEAPLDFNVTVKAQGKEETVFSARMDNNTKWRDEKIKLSGYEGKRVDIVFEVAGDGQNVGFWSNPVVYSHCPTRNYNIILVVEDALRADRVSCYGYMKGLTDVKKQWTDKGITFSNAISQATHTRASCASFMTSLYPSATGVWNAGEVLDDNYTTMAEVLRNSGYSTAMFIQNVNAGPHAGLHQGFSFVYGPTKSGGRAHDLYNGKVLKGWLDHNGDKKFFLYLHLLDPHGPYNPPLKKIRQKKPDARIWGPNRVPHNKRFDPQWLKTPTVKSRRFLYNQEVKYNDSQFAHLLEMLESRGVLKETLILFIADHGEHLGAHGIWGHCPPGNYQVLHVPLIMVCPEMIPADRDISQPVQLLDLMPTILDILEIDRKQLPIQGRSLMPLFNAKTFDSGTSRLAISEEVKFKTKADKNAFGSIFYQNWHMIHSENLQDSLSEELKEFNQTLYNNFFRTRLYNLKRDKSEQYELINYLFDGYLNHKIISFMNGLREKNKTIWQNLTKGKTREAVYDSSTVEDLKSLGYIK